MQTFYPSKFDRPKPGALVARDPAEKNGADHVADSGASPSTTAAPIAERRGSAPSGTLHLSNGHDNSIMTDGDVVPLTETNRLRNGRNQSSLYARDAGWGHGSFGLGNRSCNHNKLDRKAVVLDARIRRCETMPVLCDLLTSRLSEFDASHAVSALVRVVNFSSKTSRNATSILPVAVQELVHHVSIIEPLMPAEVASLAWALAKLCWEMDSPIWIKLGRCATTQTSSFNAQQFANTTWAFARMGQHSNHMWETISGAVPSQLDSASCAEISMILWSFAHTASATATSFPRVFALGAQKVQARLSEFSPTSLANLSWAFAKHNASLNRSDSSITEGVIEQLCKRASAVINQFSGWEVSTISWAFVTAQTIDEAILTQLATQACLCAMTIPNASTLAWAYGAAGIADVRLFSKIKSLVHEKFDELDCGSVARIAWSYGSLEISDTPLFAVLATFTMEHVAEFAVHDLSSAITGFVRGTCSDTRLLEAVAREGCRRLPTLGLLEISSLLWALAASATTPYGVRECLGVEATLFFDGVEKVLTTDVSSSDPESLSTVVSAMRKVGRFHTALKIHDRLVSGASRNATQESDCAITRRERYRLQFRTREDGYPEQISYSVLLMEAEYRGDVHLAVRLLEALAGEAQSACARACFLNVAVWEYLTRGFHEHAESLLAQMFTAKLFNCVSKQLLHKLGLDVHDLGTVPTTAAWATRCAHMSGIERSHVKEFQLLQALVSLRSCDAQSVLAEVEEFGLKRQWIKVAGGEKAAVIDAVIEARKPSCVLEYGVYVSYTSMRMALRMEPWGGEVISLEMDPVHVCIARNIAIMTGLDKRMKVQIGHSDDSIPLLSKGHQRFDTVFMDQRSTRFHSDLQILESLNMLQTGCVVIADNVLKPGAPRWLWRICKSVGYSSDIVSVREFGSAETEDWMTVTMILDDAQHPVSVPKEPSNIASLAARADRMRFRTVARNLDDTRSALEEANREFTNDFATLGICRTKAVVTTYTEHDAVSRVVPVAADQEWIGWVGSDPRLEMRGGRWKTDLSNCETVFPILRQVEKNHSSSADSWSG